MYIIAAYLVIALSVLVLAKKTVQLEKEAERNQLMQSYMVTLQGFYQTVQSQIDMTSSGMTWQNISRPLKS